MKLMATGFLFQIIVLNLIQFCDSVAPSKINLERPKIWLLLYLSTHSTAELQSSVSTVPSDQHLPTLWWPLLPHFLVYPWLQSNQLWEHLELLLLNRLALYLLSHRLQTSLDVTLSIKNPLPLDGLVTVDKTPYPGRVLWCGYLIFHVRVRLNVESHILVVRLEKESLAQVEALLMVVVLSNVSVVWGMRSLDWCDWAWSLLVGRQLGNLEALLVQTLDASQSVAHFLVLGKGGDVREIAALGWLSASTAIVDTSSVFTAFDRLLTTAAGA